MKLNKLFGKHTKKVINILIILAVIVLAGVLFNYNRTKGLLSENLNENELMNTASKEEPAVDTKPSVPNQAAPSAGPKPMLQDDTSYLNVKGLSSGKPNNVCNNKPMMDPKELLPKDGNNEWSNIMPNNDLKDVHMINAGHHVGINTVGSSLRNANLQIRSEPVIPQANNVGPWNNTTIEPDNLRRPLEIGL